MASSPWRIRVDTGGTFTDAWACAPDGRERRCKILSDGALRCRLLERDGDWLTTDSTLMVDDDTLSGWTLPDGTAVRASREGAHRLRLASTANLVAGDVIELRCGDEAPVAAARLLTGTPAGRPLPRLDFRVATTRGTNALLERKGARLAFFVTEGFEDLLLLRDQRRAKLFELAQPPNAMLPEFVAGVAGRLDATGAVLLELDEAALSAAAKRALAQGCEAAAVAFLHAWLDPVQERRAGTLLRQAGFRHVTLSSEVAPLIRLLPRAETAVADAFLGPVMDHFIRRVREPLEGGEPWLMTSAGGLIPAGRFQPKDSLLSGPAGGLVGAAEVARAAGFPKVLGFDMGGTSTDVSRIDGPFTWRYEQEIGPARVFAPALRIETVAAGGGSICQWRNGRLEVGPESAGADPGPACYGRGGPLTLTDVNLLSGRMDAARAGIPLDRAAAQARLEELMAAMAADGEAVERPADLLEGLREIAVGTMAEAIRSVSVREGCAPQDYALLAFGGAGPQHACAVAAQLGVNRVLVPADAGLLSAWGLERAQRQEQRVRQLLKPLSEAAPAEEWRQLSADARAALGEAATECRWFADLRLTGQDTALPVEVASPELPEQVLREGFAEAYRQLYGYAPPASRQVELVALRVVASEAAVALPREDFPEESESGPQLMQDRFSTCVVEDGWSCRRGSRGTLLLERVAAAKEDLTAALPAVRAGLFRSRFEGLVTGMGEMLRRTALSTNVKERLDYSCALLDAAGRLVASAPHVPVHLGALGVCVRETLLRLDPGPHDVIVTNHPACGGSHLPDVTVIAPLHDAEGRRLGFVANRAHHAEIGGRAPGSMPAAARSLAEEGVVLPPQWLVKDGAPCWEELRVRLTEAPWPSCRIADNLADLEAQLAAAAYGVAGCQRLAAEQGGEVVAAELAGVLERSAALMRSRLQGERLDRRVATAFDDGTPLALHLTVREGLMRLDFTGSGAVHPRNLNATPAIVRSAVLFALRLWIGEDIPLNEGLLEPVEIVLPEGLLNPRFPDDPAQAPAVVGGNVETSQRLCDMLLEALDLAANGPGTMNNFLFGDGTFGYYETIAGGSGAGRGHAGSSGRHVHMTNTAITDPEVMEHRYPVRLWKYGIRRNSGGAGARPGGDGVVREIEFLRPLTVSFLTERRARGPAGLAGGGDGAPGRQRRILPDGREETLPGAITYEAVAGERVRIETPGGGGWG